MNRRRLLIALTGAGAALLASCSSAPKEEDLVGRYSIDPSDPYAQLKQYRSSVNMLTARLTVSYQNLFTIVELYKEGPRGKEIMDRSLDEIKLLHKELNKYLQKAPEVRATISADNAKLLAAYDNYVKALAGVAAIDYGDISQERIDALVQAGSAMEPLIP